MTIDIFDQAADLLQEFAARYPLSRAQLVKVDATHVDVQYKIFNSDQAVWDFEWVTVDTVTVAQLDNLLSKLGTFTTRATQLRTLVVNKLAE